jgi:hypothetical protein
MTVTDVAAADVYNNNNNNNNNRVEERRRSGKNITVNITVKRYSYKHNSSRNRKVEAAGQWNDVQ